jgi:hypothetical protein
VRIKAVLSEAQNGQAYANLARAFHLPAAKVEVAVAAILDNLILDVGQRIRSRRQLASLVELLGKGDYERVLETPMLLGATHTQVVGNEALNVVAGRSESKRLTERAAVIGEVSEMIAEYLLPVLAAMLIGALAKLCRPELEEIMRQTSTEPIISSEPGQGTIELPRVSGGVGFSGSTGGSVRIASAGAHASHYDALAEDIRRVGGLRSRDAAETVRIVVASVLGLPPGPLGWMRRLQLWSSSVLSAAIAGSRR